MTIWIRNITKDTLMDFDNDHKINLPMPEDELRKLLGDDEWIVIDSPIGEEMIDILQLNDLVEKYGEERLCLLAQSFLLDEIMENDFIIIDFDEETKEYCNGLGCFPDEWWKGYLMFQLGYVKFPFEYKDEMEDYVRFETLWTTAECEGWREIKYNGNTYIVAMT